MWNYSLKSSKYEKLLGIKINNKLNIESKNEICKKARWKLNTLQNVNLHMNL